MYARLPDLVEDLEGRARVVMRQDRLRYENYLKAILAYVARERLIIAGDLAAELLLTALRAEEGANESEETPVTCYEIFCADARRHSRQLAQELYTLAPEPAEYAVLIHASSRGDRSAVIVDMRELAILRELPVERRHIASVLAPSSRRIGGHDLEVMGAEVMLIGCYAGLCDPGSADDWPALLHAEWRLRKVFFSEIRSKLHRTAAAQGGGENAALREFSRAMVGLARGPDYVLVGPAAIRKLGGAPRARNRPQLATSVPLEQVARELEAAASARGLEAAASITRVPLPCESRLRRLTVRVGGATVADLYNLPAFQAVPFVKRDGLRLGSCFSLLYLLLVDVWTLQLVRGVSGNRGHITRLLGEVCDEIAAASEIYEAFLKKGDKGSIFPTDFCGEIEDPATAEKRALRGRPPPAVFYPATQA